MIRGLYTAATGLSAGIKQQAVVSNNLANVDTAGFKREQVLFQSLLDREIYHFSAQPPRYLGQLGSGVNYRLGAPDMSFGRLLPTENTLDIAISNPDVFLAVETAAGQQPAYTRNGQLRVDDAGYLRTMAGAYVLAVSDASPTQYERLRVGIDNADNIVFQPDGWVVDSGGSRLGRLYLVQRPDEATELRRMGGSLWSFTPQAIEGFAGVRQGYLEQANVQVVQEMVGLIATMRNYEANAKLIHVQDETLNKAVNEVGRL